MSEQAGGSAAPVVPVEEQVAQANESRRVPVVFIHGLWLLPSSWDRWAQLFEQAGYAPVSPGWPDDPDTVAEALADPDVFANVVSEDEGRRLYEEFAVPASGAPLFQAATANFNPKTEAQVDTHNADRGPLLILSGENDHTVPRAISHAAFKRQEHNPGVTEFAELPGRGHSLTIDDGWAEVARTALVFIKRFT